MSITKEWPDCVSETSLSRILTFFCTVDFGLGTKSSSGLVFSTLVTDKAVSTYSSLFLQFSNLVGLISSRLLPEDIQSSSFYLSIFLRRASIALTLGVSQYPSLEALTGCFGVFSFLGGSIYPNRSSVGSNDMKQLLCSSVVFDTLFVAAISLIFSSSELISP